MASAILIMIGSVAVFGLNSPYITTMSAASIVLPNFVLVATSLVTQKMEDRHVAYIFNSDSAN